MADSFPESPADSSARSLADYFPESHADSLAESTTDPEFLWGKVHEKSMEKLVFVARISFSCAIGKG